MSDVPSTFSASFFDGHSAAQALDLFSGPIGAERIPTGFTQLDANLDGGLPVPGCTVLGAITNIGKSTFVLQVAAHVAASGRPVLFFSYEMSAVQLVSKLISRQSYLWDGPEGALTSWTVQNTEADPTDEHAREARATINAARGVLKPVLKNLFIIESSAADGQLCTARDIVKCVESYIESHPDVKPPLVIVDYLQIIPHDTLNSDRLVVNDALDTLRTLSAGRAAVLLVSSLNRLSYKDPVRLASFKETGMIEYSADLLLGIQFAAVGSKGYDPDLEKARNPRRLQVVVPKNRYGDSGERVSVRIDHYAQFNHFAEAPTDATAAHDANERFYRNIAYGISDLLRGPRDPGKPCSLDGTNYLQTEVAYSGRAAVFRVYERPGEQIGPFDMLVADAVYTLYRRALERGEGERVTPRSVTEVLAGKKRTVTPQRRRDIEESLGRLQGARIAIDCHAEAKEWKGVDEQTIEWLANTHPFLTLAPDGSGGFLVGDGRRPLPLWRYAELRHHMISVPSWVLRVEAPARGKRGFRFSEDNILLTHYLMMRAERLRSRNNRQQNPRISFTRATAGDSGEAPRQGGMLAALGWDVCDRDAASINRKVGAVRKAAQEVLDYFEREGYIDGYALEDDHILLKTVHNPWET